MSKGPHSTSMVRVVRELTLRDPGCRFRVGPPGSGSSESPQRGGIG